MSYWKWNNVIPKNVCEALVKEVNKTRILQIAAVGGIGPGIHNPELRNNTVCFLNTNHWFEGILFNHIRYANVSTGWNYNITGCQSIQYTKYNINEKYDWHTDMDMNAAGEPDNYRKLSAVCQISDSKDFEGGGLYLEGIDGSILSEQGDIVVFPSYMKHKAETVTSGTRITAVCWATGPAFK